MNSETSVQDEQLCHLISKIVERGLALAKTLEGEKYRSRHNDLPSISIKDNGLPRFSLASLWSDNAPIDYTHIFVDAKMKFTAEDNYRELAEYAKTNDRLKEFFFYEEKSDDFDMFFILTTKILDRYIHVYNTLVFDQDKFLSLYFPFEHYLYWSQLPVAIMVPILFANFDFESSFVTSEISIEKMGEITQLSRMKDLVKTYSSHPLVNPDIVSSATHAFIYISDWTIPNENFVSIYNINAASPGVLASIDRLFASMRLLEIESGYAQVCLLPIGWEARYTGKLNSTISTLIRNYPAVFEDWHWQNEIERPLITETQAQEIGEIYHKLQSLNNKSVNIAVRRLNRCLLREEEEDAILDATIGLETLLIEDKDNKEITHKLATRIAALWHLIRPDEDPYQIFQSVKRIYSLRSAIVHGTGKTEKPKEIDILGKKMTYANAAVECLRVILRVLIENPKYLEPKNIDKDLLLGSTSDNH